MIIPSLFYHNSEQFIGPASPFLGCKKYSRLFFPNTKCMNKNKQFCGIGISKDVFDVVDHNDNHHQYPNDEVGFKEFHKILTKKSHCVMEVTGSYYQCLASWLHSKSIEVSVVNPLSVKRFIQMRLNLWQPPSEYIIEANELHRLVTLLLRQRTALKNKLHGLNAKGVKKGPVISSIRRQIRNLDTEVSVLELKLEEVVKAHQADLITRLCSIPGIGKRTAIY